MERLTIDEVIEHCKRHTERMESHLGRKQLEEIPIRNSNIMKQYWEHRQVAEWLEELKAYKDAEEQRLLLRLPCKVGDALYMPWEYDWNTGVAIITVKKIVIDWEDCFYVDTDLYSDSKAFLEEYNYGKFSFSDFGKTVFLTKEEAEQALAEMKGV